MAGWGLMMGLGQGLQGLGQTLMDNNKEKMRQQLENEREARRAKLDYAKEQRQVARESQRVASEGVTFDESGNPYRVTRNSNDQVLSREPLSAYEAERMRRTAEMEDAKGELELRLAEGRAALTDKELSYYDQDKSLEHEATRASIFSSYQNAAAAGRRNVDEAPSFSVSEASDVLRKRYDDLSEELEVPVAQRTRMARRAIEWARANNLDAGTVYEEFLRKYPAALEAEEAKRAAEKGKGGGGMIGGGR